MQNFLRRTTHDILINMKYCTYIHGRTLNIDFREICSPKGGLSKETISLIEQLINTDVVSNGDISRLRYLFVRERQQVLFGVGFNHRQFLDKNLWTDLTGRRGLRSFVGIVIDNEDFDRLTSIPIDYCFFKDLYLKNISPIWELEDRPKNRNVIISDAEEIEQSDTWCKLDGNIVFNSDDKCCRFFVPTEEDSVIRSIKNCQSSVVIGLNVESHVISAFRKFNVAIPNAICLDTQINHDFELIVTAQDRKEPTNKQNNQDGKSKREHKLSQNKRRLKKVTETGSNDNTYEPAILSSLKKYEPSENDNSDSKQSQDNNLMNIDWGDDYVDTSSMVSCDSPNNEISNNTIESDNTDSKGDYTDLAPIDIVAKKIDTDDKPKKVCRPVMMITIAVVVIILLTVVLCSKRNRNSSPSPLGGKEMKQGEKMKVGKKQTSDTITTHTL